MSYGLHFIKIKKDQFAFVETFKILSSLYFEWYMARDLVKRVHQTYTYCDKLNMFVQNLLFFLSSIVNALGSIGIKVVHNF